VSRPEIRAAPATSTMPAENSPRMSEVAVQSQRHHDV
jgi:hypothetical protein